MRWIVAVGVAAAIASPAAAYVRRSFNDKNAPTISSWSTFSFPLEVHLNSNLGKEPNIRAGSDARTAILNGFKAWERVSTAGVRFSVGADSAVNSSSGSDGINVVSFADTPDNRSDVGDAIAVTLTFFIRSTGDITSGDIIFSPTKTFSTNGETDAYDIQGVATHEIGHFLGLDHSGIGSATMFPFGKLGDLSARTLDPDDRAGISTLYPSSSFNSTTGRISGRITSGGAAVFGAHVVAIDTSTGIVTAGAVSLGDGSYLIAGLPPASYRVVAEPLDGPVEQDNLGGIFDSSVKSNFRSAALGGSTPSNVNVSAGIESVRRDIDVGTATASLNLTLLGTESATTPGSFLLGSPPLVVARGRDFQLAVGSTSTTFGSAVNAMEIAGSGITFDFARRGVFSSNRGFVVTLTIAADAPLGARNVAVRNDTTGELSILPGGLIIIDQRKLLFPRIESSGTTFTGIALSNPNSSTDAVITFELLNDAGSRQATSGGVNPSARFLFGDQQLAQLVSEVFNLPGSLTEGWAEVSVWDDPDVVGFFVYFNDRITLFDGAGVSTRKGRQLWFNAVEKSASGSTELAVVNPGTSAVTGTLKAFAENGSAVGGTIFVTIPARGRLTASNGRRTLADFFPAVSFSGGGHVELDLSGEVTGTEVFGNSSRLAMLAGMFPEDAASTLYSAQLAHGVGNFFTRVDVSNPSDSTATLTLTANLVDSAGNVTSRPTATRTLAARGKLSEDAATLFNLGTSQVQGWIQVSSTRAVIGSVTFGDSGGRFEASVPMQGTGRTRATFSQVAHGAGSPFYTGIALLNPDTTRAAQVTIDVFREDGSKSGTASLRLEAGQRLSRLLDQFVSALAAGQVRGYIRISSDLPVFTFELFGDTGGESLVGVPPQ
jgi:hypothetical protein